VGIELTYRAVILGNERSASAAFDVFGWRPTTGYETGDELGDAVDDLDGKVGVVTGAASGIGRSLALAFAAEGVRLVLADIESDPLEAVASELRANGADVFAVTADVSDAGDVERIGTAADDVYGALHLACNNAGVGGGGLSWEIDLETWKWVLGVNLFGVIHGIHSFVPRIIASGGGHVVNTASMAGLTSNPGMGPYNASKHAVVTISESLALELAMVHPEVGVTVLCPGWVRTQINRSDRNRPGASAGEGGLGGESGSLSRMLDHLIETGMDPDDVAALVVDAVRTRKFAILTHPDWSDAVSARTDRLLVGELPEFRLPGTLTD
jgi:NAD(P)-dependent dehydrogenase (short-subunit alcohol dehydrogenase family)